MESQSIAPQKSIAQPSKAGVQESIAQPSMAQPSTQPQPSKAGVQPSMALSTQPPTLKSIPQHSMAQNSIPQSMSLQKSTLPSTDTLECIELPPEELSNFLPPHPQSIDRIFSYIDSQTNRYIGELREAVSIRSVSTQQENRSEVLRMVQWTGEKLKSLGFTIELRKLGEQTCGDSTLPLPPVLLAQLGHDPNKMTLLIYGHLDVKPAEKETWSTDPFILTESNGDLIGRGVTDNKGPVLGWMNAIEAFVKLMIEVPINVKIVMESMGESESKGFHGLVFSLKDKFFSNIDLVCVSDNYWLGTKPCICYGLRGLCYFFLEVEGGTKDLHSGVYGGAIQEPMSDLVYLLNTLIDVDGTILIPGLLDSVFPLTLEESDLYEKIDFDLEDFQCDAGVPQLLYPDDKVKTLMSRWRSPSISIHGIQGDFSTPGATTVIPRKVIGKFSIRLVPNQTPGQIGKLVTHYMKEKWDGRGSRNVMRCYMADDGLPPWTGNPMHPGYRAARGAVAFVYNEFPDMIREGGFSTTVLELQELTGRNVCLLPMCCGGKGAHGEDERMSVKEFVNGTKVMAAYIHQIGELGRINGND